MTFNMIGIPCETETAFRCHRIDDFARISHSATPSPMEQSRIFNVECLIVNGIAGLYVLILCLYIRTFPLSHVFDFNFILLLVPYVLANLLLIFTSRRYIVTSDLEALVSKILFIFRILSIYVYRIFLFIYSTNIDTKYFGKIEINIFI